MRSGFLARSRPSGENDRNETTKPPKRRFRGRATPAKHGICPGCWPTEVGGPAGRLWLRGVCTGVNSRHGDARGGVAAMAPICDRVHAKALLRK